MASFTIYMMVTKIKRVYQIHFYYLYVKLVHFYVIILLPFLSFHLTKRCVSILILFITLSLSTLSLSLSLFFSPLLRIYGRFCPCYFKKQGKDLPFKFQYTYLLYLSKVCLLYINLVSKMQSLHKFIKDPRNRGSSLLITTYYIVKLFWPFADKIGIKSNRKGFLIFY